jgi:preprotein translocase subunit SecG
MNTIRSAAQRITVVWIVMSALTVVSWWLASTRGGHHVASSLPEAVAVLAIAAVKAHFITQDFMEVRGAPTWLRRSTDAWLASLWTAILVLYLA